MRAFITILLYYLICIIIGLIIGYMIVAKGGLL
jgi:hypothetical protein